MGTFYILSFSLNTFSPSPGLFFMEQEERRKESRRSRWADDSRSFFLFQYFTPTAGTAIPSSSLCANTPSLFLQVAYRNTRLSAANCPRMRIPLPSSTACASSLPTPSSLNPASGTSSRSSGRSKRVLVRLCL